jgi:hypothetical protein
MLTLVCVLTAITGYMLLSVAMLLLGKGPAWPWLPGFLAATSAIDLVEWVRKLFS